MLISPGIASRAVTAQPFMPSLYVFLSCNKKFNKYQPYAPHFPFFILNSKSPLSASVARARPFQPALYIPLCLLGESLWNKKKFNLEELHPPFFIPNFSFYISSFCFRNFFPISPNKKKTTPVSKGGFEGELNNSLFYSSHFGFVVLILAPNWFRML
jgi:hypothetical protein